MKTIDADNPPVTFSVIWHIQPGKADAFQGILDHMIGAAAQSPGNLGVTAFQPSDPQNPIFHVLEKFDSKRHLEEWQASGECLRWLEQAKPLARNPPAIQTATGLEAWFSLPGIPAQIAPAKYKTIVTTLVGIYPLIEVLGFIVPPALNALGLAWLPLPLKTLISLCIAMPLMTYFVMPMVTKLFAGWLYPTVKAA